jgi:hypothetical protein
VSTTPPTVTVEIDFTTDLSAGLSYAEHVLASGPYSYYRLKETAGTSHADASGNSVTGTSSGLTLNQTSGKPVTGETASRYVNFGSRIAYTPPSMASDRLTLEAWVYRTTLDGSGSTHYYIAAGFNGVGLSFHVKGDGRLKVSAYPNTLLGTDNYLTTNSVITAATWYHVAVSLDGPNNIVQFYVNGAAVATTNNNSNPSFFLNEQSAMYWGTNLAGGATPISRIAEPAVYLDILDAGTISDHYDAAATTPFAGYTWTDVTEYVYDDPGVTRRFGRESEIEDVTPMELTYTLRNDDRRFEIENADSPYYPNVVAGRPTRIRMVQNAVTYDWAFGFVEDWPQEWRTSRFCHVPIVAHCFLERMNQDEISARSFRENLTGSRMTVLLNAAGQPTSMRDLDTGVHTLMEQTVESGTVGEHARQAARSDRGLLFFDGRGYAVFQDGDARMSDSRSVNEQGTLGDPDLGEIPYRHPQFHAPSSLIRNEITIRRPGGVDQTVSDGGSQSRHGHRTYSDELLLTTDALAAERAADLLADYSTQTLRIRALSFNPQAGAGFWTHALGIQISDRYMWAFRPEQGDPLERPVFVEGVSDVYRSSEYIATWFLSLAPEGT